MRWYIENPIQTNQVAPRAINVGLPLDLPCSIDAKSTIKHGMAIPEADRDVKKGHIYYDKRRAIAAIPVIDEDGKKVEQTEIE